MAIFSFLNDFLWFPNLFLNGGAVIPTYFSMAPSLEETVAWYTMFFSRHCPSRGHTAFFGQLHVLTFGLGLSWLRILELCADIFEARFGVHM